MGHIGKLWKTCGKLWENRGKIGMIPTPEIKHG